jgi:hypothetical protein
MLQHAGAPFQ